MCLTIRIHPLVTFLTIEQDQSFLIGVLQTRLNERYGVVW